MGKSDDGRHIPLFHNRRPERPKAAGDDRRDDKTARKDTRRGDAQTVRGTKKKDDEGNSGTR
jgi:hypothetical protein